MIIIEFIITLTLIPQIISDTKVSLTISIKNLSGGQHWSFLIFDVRMTQEFYMKEISSMDFPQHGEVFYFYGLGLHKNLPLESFNMFKKLKIR
jgi:hypothetical protein